MSMSQRRRKHRSLLSACYAPRRLLTATQTEDEVKGGLLLDVVVAEGTAILELLTSEDKTLLVWGDALLVLNLRLDVVDGVG
jgi:hypothetical protein